MSLPQLFVDGSPVNLGNRICRGGEGEVYALSDRPDRAVKFYTVHDGAAREAKIAAIVSQRLAERTSLIAFPIAIARDRAGRFMGFVMQLVREHQPLFELYSPGARKQNFPEASYPFLVRAALNTARAVTAAHETGCVIGDINHSGILISRKATAALIDADSFQVVHGANRFLCRVGVPEYTPPELQGKNLSSIERTPNHDAFGLAIVLFQLLAMGRHPFVGSYSKGDMPIEKAIVEYRFAYSLRRSVGMTPPPGACTLKDFPQPLGDAFEATFGQAASQRPTAKQWVALLEQFEKTLVKCRANALHHHSSAAAECPWCRMEKRLGIVLFLPTYADYTTQRIRLDASQLNLAQIWAQIDAAVLPSRAQSAPQVASMRTNPRPEAVLATRKRYAPIGIRLGAVALALFVVAANQALWLVGLGVAGIGLLIARNLASDVTKSYRQRIAVLDQELRNAFAQWEQRCGIDRAEQLKSSLREARSAYEGLGQEEQRSQAQYLTDRENRQRREFLERFRIRDYKIKGIGPTKLATLASYGIETAADVGRAAVLAVPGFGPTNSQPLFDWQLQCSRGFVYNTQPTPMDRAERARIVGEFQKRASALRDQITRAAGDYLQAVQACRTMLVTPDPLLSALSQRRTQLEVDCKLLGIRVGPRPIFMPSPSPQPPQRTLLSSTQGTRSRAARQQPQTNTPTCPLCHNRMVRRTARRGRRSGNAFWGCSRYPVCRGTRPI